jgi:trimeric autotransporter adhesin
MRVLKAAILAGVLLMFAVPAYAVTLTSAYVSNPGPVNAMNTGGALQVYAYCKYSDGSTTQCSTTDIHGNAVTAWTSSNSAVLTVNSSGLASGAGIGTATINATITGGIVGTPPFVVTVSGPNTLGLSSLSLATTGGVTSIPVGTTNQLIATCTYADGSTTNCTTTDIHGSAVSSFTSSAPTVATVSSSGLVSGVGAGSTAFRATIP